MLDTEKNGLIEEKSISAEIQLYWELYKPSELQAGAPLLIVCHGYGGNKTWMMRQAVRFAPDGVLIASLQGVHQHFIRGKDGEVKTGFAWLTNHNSDAWIELFNQNVLDVIAETAKEGIVDKEKIILIGFSQASALCFRFAFRHPEQLRGVIGICGGIPSDLETNKDYQKFAGSGFYLFAENDEFYPKEKLLENNQKLSKWIKDYEGKSYDADHRITEEMRRDIKLKLEGWLK